ncbi:hypothetical protein [Alkalilacustris brevis]|uniref:hypothetical protein n=1 Tax=Alkalilacustris brevis TaxID=2026338 RepID=UPI00139032D1|nr:hypothetical protein [Alkalilacustris brevis]
MAERFREALQGVLAAGTLVVTAAAGAWAQPPEQEVFRGDGAEVTLHLHGFLTQEELLILRQIAASPEARLALLGETEDGHAAIALAPDEGFIRDGAPANSAAALSGLPDAAAAQAAAMAACEGARAGGGADCVVVLEVAPGG